VTRRLIDIVVGVTSAALLSPLALIVALGIRSSCGSPVLFRQERSGRDGRIFVIYKFRTMRPEAYPGEPDSLRSLPLGRFLRSSSLDELPQLWNIIRGDMSLIGPRPTLPDQVAHYSAHQRGRLAVPPGLTGWAQVNGRNSLSWPERIELDLWYIQNRSLLLDLRIAMLTLLSLVRPHGIVGADGENPGFPAESPVPPVTALIAQGRRGVARGRGSGAADHCPGRRPSTTPTPAETNYREVRR
jgi:lipopolysaccharide/colanic/teichoic acid biosynthesis glycosyltransferase